MPRQPTQSTSATAARSIVACRADTGGLFAVVTVILPPHDPGIPPHRHAHHAEGCYVVEGTLALTQDESTTILTPESVALVLPGVLHAFWNPTAAPTTIVLSYHPGASEAEAIALAIGAQAEQGRP